MTIFFASVTVLAAFLVVLLAVEEPPKLVGKAAAWKAAVAKRDALDSTGAYSRPATRTLYGSSSSRTRRASAKPRARRPPSQGGVVRSVVIDAGDHERPFALGKLPREIIEVGVGR